MEVFGKKIVIEDLEHGERINSAGIIIPDTGFNTQNIKPRWGKVVAVGEEISDIKVGDWIFIQHGRWTHGIRHKENDVEKMVWMVDYDGVMLVADEKPEY